MSSSSAPAISAQDLRVEFSSRSGTTHALRSVTLQAQRGEITTILGTNGAGKSTFLRVLQGLQRPTAGRAEVLGQEPLHAGAEHRARVGVMLQETGLPQGVKPLEFLSHLHRFYRHARPVRQLAEELDILSFAHTRIRSLSGGQKQRVALAAAVIGRPELCMLDEPSAGLDPASRVLVADFISALRDEGASVVLTTHLLDDAERLSDTVHILSRGRVLQSGTPLELTESVGRQNLVLLVRRDDAASLEPLLEAARADHLHAVREERGSLISLTLSGEITQHVLARAAQTGAPGRGPLSLSLNQANLQDVFMETVAREHSVPTAAEEKSA